MASDHDLREAQAAAKIGSIVEADPTPINLSTAPEPPPPDIATAASTTPVTSETKT